MLIWRECCSIGGKITTSILPNLSERTCMRMHGTRSLILADSLCVGTEGGVSLYWIRPNKRRKRGMKKKKGEERERNKESLSLFPSAV